MWGVLCSAGWSRSSVHDSYYFMDWCWKFSLPCPGKLKARIRTSVPPKLKNTSLFQQEDRFLQLKGADNPSLSTLTDLHCLGWWYPWIWLPELSGLAPGPWAAAECTQLLAGRGGGPGWGAQVSPYRVSCLRRARSDRWAVRAWQPPVCVEGGQGLSLGPASRETWDFSLHHFYQVRARRIYFLMFLYF